MQYLNKVINGDVLEVLSKIPSNSAHVDLDLTSIAKKIGFKYHSTIICNWGKNAVAF